MRRFLRQVGTAAAIMLLSVAFAPKAEAALMQIGSFQSASGLYTYNAGSLTGMTTGDYTFDTPFATLFGLPTTTFSASLTITANATGTASGFPSLSQAMDGTIVVTDVSTSQVLVSTTFTNAFLTGLLGSNTVALFGSTGVGTTVTYASNFFNAALVGPPSDISFVLNPTSAAVALSGGNFANFSAPDTANFSTTVQTPETASLALFGLGLTAVGAIVRRRRNKQ